MSMTRLEHALDAIDRGLRVLPAAGKVPKIRKWPENATANPKVAERWWTRWPDADIGIALTPDLYVFDADSPAAIDALNIIVGSDMLSCGTLTVATARGFHAYFRVPFQLARLTPQPGATGLHAIEGKGIPGPVTWAGSIHSSGWRYEIVDDLPIANMPAYLVREIGPKRSQATVGDATPTERALYAARHTTLFAKTLSRNADAADQAAFVLGDTVADLRLVLRALRLELPDMPSGWADRFFRAGAYLGPSVACGGLDFDETIQELTAVFHELDTDGGDPGHVLRSIERGLATGAREAGL